MIVHAAQKELRINASCKPDLKKYRETFGLHLFGDAEKFVYAEQYTLEPLRAQGEAALRCKDVEGMESVRLGPKKVYTPSEEKAHLFYGKEYSLNASTDVTRHLTPTAANPVIRRIWPMRPP